MQGVRGRKILSLVPRRNISSDNDSSSSSEDETPTLSRRIDDDDTSSAPSVSSSLENLSIFSESEVDDIIREHICTENLEPMPLDSPIPTPTISNTTIPDFLLHKTKLSNSLQTSVASPASLTGSKTPKLVEPIPLDISKPTCSNSNIDSATATPNILREKRKLSNSPSTSVASPASFTRSKRPKVVAKRKGIRKSKILLNFKWERKPFEYCATVTDKNLLKSNLKTPYEYFSLFFSDEIFDMIVSETNLYSTQVTGKSISVSNKDIKDFVAINILMGIVNMPAYTDYWCQAFRYERISNIMSLKKFQQIRRFIHFNNNLLDDGDRYYKVRPLVQMLRENCLKIEHETKFSIDEMIVPYKGTRAGNRKQYIKNKPRKWGFKIFVRAGVSGFIYDFLLYGGEDTFRFHTFPENEESLGLGAKVVLALCQSIPNPACSVVYFDNFFTSLELIKILRENYGIFSLGTIRGNRIRGAEKSLDSDKKLQKKGRGSFSQVVCNENKVCIVKWSDNKCVTVASSYVDSYPLGQINRYNKESKKREPVSCPEIIKHYNAHMGGVDLADMLVALYRTELKGHRWYLPLVSQVIDICVNNAWILYRRNLPDNSPKNQIIPLKKFRYSIYQSLTQFGRDKRKKDSENRAPSCIIRNPSEPRPNTDIRYDKHDHFPSFSSKGRCKFCTKGQTSVFCQKCLQRLCLLPDRNCFYAFHHPSQ